MRVLIVEDDRALGAFLKRGVELEGHQVEWVGDGETALSSAEEYQPDLMLLDLSLPKRDGMDVLAALRSHNVKASVLVLTGRNDVDARIRCLDLGADDCLLKPFSFFELTARMRAVMRRRDRSTESTLRHGDLELNRIDRRVARAGRTVELTAREFVLLEYLLLHRERCVPRAELLTEVWQMPADAETNIVDVYINYVRRKLQTGLPAEAKDGMIETVRGQGYRLAGSGRKPVASVAASSPRLAFA